MGDGPPFAPREVFPHTRRGEKRRRSFPLYTRRRKKDSVSFRRHARQKNAPHEAQRASQPPAAHWAAGAFSRWNVPRYIPAKLLYENLIKAFILVLDKKLSKLFIAPQARQELMRRHLRQTAAKGRRRQRRLLDKNQRFLSRKSIKIVRSASGFYETARRASCTPRVHGAQGISKERISFEIRITYTSAPHLPPRSSCRPGCGRRYGSSPPPPRPPGGSRRAPRRRR